MAGGDRGRLAAMAAVLALCLAAPLRPAAQEHSATKAMLLSLAPGGGQIYNRQAWKLPIIYGAFAGMGYLVYDNYKSMRMFRDEYLYRVQHQGATSLEGYDSYSTQNIYSLYNSYNQQFQLMIIITAGIYALNLVDAYVFGHLFDFQIGDDIALMPSAMPTVGGPAAGLGILFNF
ncbi:MAG: hypothetical protein IJ760_02935 [Bacteroidales bacterium]|nr:hypothetical protein [Bacteroidales bacterium]